MRAPAPEVRAADGFALQRGLMQGHISRTMPWRRAVGFALVILGWVLGLGAATGAPLLGESAVLTTAGAVHDLPASLAADARVHLVGTVTYYDPLNKVLFLQDSTGGTFINTDKVYPLQEGDLIAVDGYTEPSYRTDVAMDPAIRVLGRGPRYAAPLYTYHELVSGQADSRLATIRGRVRAADVGQHSGAPLVHLDVAMDGGEVEIYVTSAAGFHQGDLLDAEIQVTGVAGGTFDAKWQATGVILYTQEASSIQVLREPRMSAFELPLTDIDDVLPTLSTVDTSERVRVRGTLTYYQKGDAAVIQQDGKSMYVQTRQTTDLAIGDLVDAFGFASTTGYAPGLREALILKTGGREPIQPKHVSYAEALSGTYSDNLISLSGRLVSELHDVGSDTLVMEVDGHLVSAYLEGSAPLTSFPVGSLVRIAGICRVAPGNPWQAPYIFHLEMRDTADVWLIASPSWWTIEHLVELLGACATLALAIAAWAMVLRARVLRQTRRIQRSMTVAGERSRILREISSNQSSPNVLLTEICESVKALLPGTLCSFQLASEPLPAGSEAKRHVYRLFEATLRGPEGEVLGSILASTQTPRSLSADQQEIYAMVCEVANLAIQQSLLYQGLVHHSTHDPLTELPNRRLCESRLDMALQEAERQSGRLLVIYIDVNAFKQVNDSYGHKAGDIYLRQISKRLLAQIRPADTLARVGGDEFIVIAPFSAIPEAYEPFTARLEACFDDPFYLEGVAIKGSASFGIASYPGQGTTAEELQRCADQAMYLAKQSAGGKVRDRIDIAITTPQELELALGKEQFRLYYQPQFSSEGRLAGLEALLRLEDPILGMLTPDAFISVAERSHVIRDLGIWVLRHALEDAMRWNLDTGEFLVLAVNVSVAQLQHADFAMSVLACLEESSFPAERLELELVERSLVSSNSEVLRQLERLRAAGVRISLDDFGTGHSCLSMLHKLPIDTVKLDRSFILAMDDDPRVIPILQAIASMAASLGKRVVAEGLEHAGNVAPLLKMGTMDFQGYLLGRPIPIQQVEEAMHGWRAGIEMPAAFREFGRIHRGPTA